MTRQECEQVLIGMMESAFRIFREYNPDGKWLTMSIRNGDISVSDCNMHENGEPLLYSEGYKFDDIHSIYCTKSEYGIRGTDSWRATFNNAEE